MGSLVRRGVHVIFLGFELTIHDDKRGVRPRLPQAAPSPRLSDAFASFRMGHVSGRANSPQPIPGIGPSRIHSSVTVHECVTLKGPSRNIIDSGRFLGIPLTVLTESDRQWRSSDARVSTGRIAAAHFTGHVLGVLPSSGRPFCRTVRGRRSVTADQASKGQRT